MDYHFVNRNNFKSKISEGEIVDHYESAADKHLYGTSRSAITAVAHRNKAAILCPNHPRVGAYENLSLKFFKSAPTFMEKYLR